MLDKYDANKFNEVDDESLSVFSKSSSSPTPDGISLDSLSLSNDEDTVVDSLEFPDDSLTDSAQILNKEEVKSISPKLSQSVKTKANNTFKEPSQIDIRESFFLFDDSENSKPFDIIKNVTVQGKNVTEAGSSLTAIKKLQKECGTPPNKEHNQPLSISSNARQRNREKKEGARGIKANSEKTQVNKSNHSKALQVHKTDDDKTTMPSEKSKSPSSTVHQARPSPQPRFSLTGDMLAKGKQLLKPPVNKTDQSTSKPQLHTQQNLPRFSLDASVLQVQKGQLKSVQTREPPPLNSVSRSLLPINEDGLPSMANILKKALDERRFAMGDNPESQEYTPEASWSLQDD
ncbi:hypothetical protein EGW08_014948 [Elysia chlorotica]|uniref:Uncharacterized protein n=1 Tax=Elysia chlorotica TaxID=188477 RepID=A0A3S1B6K6_ELYCH|nr:hypothetical protein EGW08_014948 [Elysia chlorotica]